MVRHAFGSADSNQVIGYADENHQVCFAITFSIQGSCQAVGKDLGKIKDIKNQKYG